MTKVRELKNLGLSVWLDDLSKSQLDSGEIDAWVDKGVTGITTNPTIFKNAIVNDTNKIYNEKIIELKRKKYLDSEIVQQIMVEDVQRACEIFSKINKPDGFVSLEVDPFLANDAKGTVDQALELIEKVNRNNVMIKVPATRDGLVAISELISRGISVNVTLIFSLERYQEVLDAWFMGLIKAQQNNLDLSKIYSVASFFISRLDSEINPLLESNQSIKDLRGKVAIANALSAFDYFVEFEKSTKWQDLLLSKANIQRPLWASTGVKDSSASDLHYVINLLTDKSVNTVPKKTLQSIISAEITFNRIEQDRITNSKKIITKIKESGIDLNKIFEKLENDGVRLFQNSWKELVNAVRDSHS